MRYREQLGDVVKLLDERPDSPCIYHLFPIRVDDRDALAAALRADGIATGVHYPVAVPDHPALPELSAAETPVARDWSRRELSLPIFPEMSRDEVEHVARQVRSRVIQR
jgi:dTDP-4-amino-4,6-dideoxygalactose transaminase